MEKWQRIMERDSRTRVVRRARKLVEKLDAEAFLSPDERVTISAALYLLSEGVDRWDQFHAELDATGSPRHPE